MRSSIALAFASLIVVSSTATEVLGSEPSESESSGDSRPQFLWLQAEAGGARVVLNTFAVDERTTSAGFQRQASAGPMIGAGAGLRLHIITLGPRARLAFLDRFKVATIGGELGIRVPLDIVEPHVDLAGGYASIGDLPAGIGEAVHAVAVDGYFGRVGGGLDVHICRGITVGATVSGDLMVVTPDGVSAATAREIGQSIRRGDAADAVSQIKKVEGTSYGTGLTISGALGFHY